MSTQVNIPPSSGGGSSAISSLTPSAATAGFIGASAAGTWGPETVSQSQTILGIQPSSAVNITGGTITGVNTATATVQGAMPASSKGFEDARFGWARDAFAVAQAQVGNVLTQCREIPLDALAVSVSAVPANYDGLYEGGPITNTASLLHLSTFTFRAVKSKAWMYAYVGILPLPTSTKVYQAGIVNAAHTASISAGSDYATSTTKFVLRGEGTAVGTIAADTNPHVFMVLNDLTNIHMYVDNVDIGATIATSTLTDEPMGPFIFGTDVATTKLFRFLVAWVQ
jgi:hypothetical protein